MRLLVCGGRDYPDFNKVWSVLTEMHQAKPITLLIHGGATGADAWAAAWAATYGVRAKEFLADWKRYGNGAGPKRNGDMIRYGDPDLVLAFPGRNGTADMVRQARASFIAVKIVG